MKLLVILFFTLFSLNAWAFSTKDYFLEVQNILDELDINFLMEHNSCITDPNQLAAFIIFTTSKALLICKEKFQNDVAKMVTSVTHEMVHVAQDCKGDIDNNDFVPILTSREHIAIINFNPRLWSEIKRLYDEDHWISELEAFFLQDYPERTLEMVYYWCDL